MLTGIKNPRPPPCNPSEKDQCSVDEQPRELPVDLWNSCLQALFLQGNQIKWLPDYLGKFNALQRLDISGWVPTFIP